MFAFAGVLALAVILAGVSAQAEDKDKVPTIKEVMQKAHAKDSLRVTVAKAVKAKDWDEAAKEVKEWEKLGDALEKNTPKKGEPDSWKQKTTAYNKTLKTLAEAVKDNDAKKATGALSKINSMCGSCHKEHK